MLPKWSAGHAAMVSDRVATILDKAASHPASEVEFVRRTKGLPVYGGLGGAIALTASGDFLLYDGEAETVSVVQEELWLDVGLASLVRHYPEFRDLLPDRPAHSHACPNCSGTGWMMDGRLFCRRCRGLGWVATP